MENLKDLEKDSLEKVKSRVEYLEKTNSWYFIALERLASLWDLDKEVKLYRDPKFLFINARKHLKQFMKFRTLAFYRLDESNHQFLLEDCDPEPDRDLVEEVTRYQIEQGNFAWALKQSRPLLLREKDSGHDIILHAVATKTQILGMFVGRLEKNVCKVPIEQLHLVSIILSNTAYAIENGSLFKHIEDQKKNLEQTVKERTRILEEKGLELKKEIAERAKIEDELKRSNQDLQDFASIASHDLQEPLRKVIMFGDRLKDQFSPKMNQKALGFLDRMGNAASRMQVLIDELLLFSRVSSKANPFKKINLETTVREVLSDLESGIIQSEAKIDLENLPTVEADEMQMRQLFQNLIGNALKFHKKDIPPEVMIGGRVNDSNTCEILVKDNGIGFDKKYDQRIFKPFERLHGRSDFEGTGMGLAICSKIVKRHGGSIRVETHLNGGCKFYITLPLKQLLKETNP